MGGKSSKPAPAPVVSAKPYMCNTNDYLWLDAPATSRNVTVNGRRGTCLTKCDKFDEPVVRNNVLTGEMTAVNTAGRPVYTSTQYYPCQRYATDPPCPKIDISCKVNTNTGTPAGVNLPSLSAH